MGKIGNYTIDMSTIQHNLEIEDSLVVTKKSA